MSLADLSLSRTEFLINAIQQKTKFSKPALRQQLKILQQKHELLPTDPALELAQDVLANHFNDGQHLLKITGGQFMSFTRNHWVASDQSELRNLLLNAANQSVLVATNNSLTGLVGQAFTCLNDLLGNDQNVMIVLGQISEEKRLGARRAYGRTEQDFICRALTVMTGNNYPLTNDLSFGTSRRAMVNPWPAF